MPRTDPGEADDQESIRAAAARNVAEVDSELVTAYWRRLHAVWDEDVERLEEAREAIDVLLERRFELMPAQGAEAASTCEAQAPVG
ncbi:MAG TPA: hypothetical protein VH373_02720 [Jatrophihabitantaceae bacterium]|jgi:hypothetical protein